MSEAQQTESDRTNGTERSIDYDLRKRKRVPSDAVVANSLGSASASMLSDKDETEAKKRKVFSEPRQRPRRASAFGLPTIHEIPSPPPMEPMARAKDPTIASHVTNALLKKQLEKVYNVANSSRIVPPPPPPSLPPPPRVARHQLTDAAPSSARQSGVTTTTHDCDVRSVDGERSDTSRRSVAPPPTRLLPPPRARVDSAPIMAARGPHRQPHLSVGSSSAAPPSLLPQPPITRTSLAPSILPAARPNALMPLDKSNRIHRMQLRNHSKGDCEGEDSMPALTVTESSSFDSMHSLEEAESPKAIQPGQSLFHKVMAFAGALTMSLCLLLVAVGISLHSGYNPGLHLHLLLPPDGHNVTYTMEESQLKQYWKNHAPPQAIELYEYVESMNRQYQARRTKNSHHENDQTRHEMTTAVSPPGPMCMSFLVQSVSDLLASTNIKVSFPEIMLHRKNWSSRSQPSVLALPSPSEQASTSTDLSSTALVLSDSSNGENALLSRMAAFSFPLFAWMHAEDQHMLAMPSDPGHDVRNGNEAKVLSLEIRPCDDEEDAFDDTRTRKKKKRRRIFQRVLKHTGKTFQRIIGGASRKVQQEADKFGKTIHRGANGLKDNTGKFFISVTSWHKNKKWL